MTAAFGWPDNIIDPAIDIDDRAAAQTPDDTRQRGRQHLQSP
jgi:hypothetical protein